MIKKVLLSCALISSIVSGYAIADGFPRMHPKSKITLQQFRQIKATLLIK